MRKIASHLVLTPQGLLPNRVVTFDDDGTVLSVEECRTTDRMAGVEWYGGILIPGMVNAHCHLELSYLRGRIAPHEGFSGFAAGLRASRSLATDEQIRQSIEYWDAVMWQQGVQAVGDVCNSEHSLEVKSRSRIYYHSFAEVYGLNRCDASPVEGLCRRARELALEVSVTPHSLYSLSDEAYVDCCRSPRLSLHFAESAEEMELFERRGAMWEWYQRAGFNAPFIGQYDSPVERLMALTPATRKMLLVHACEVTEEDVRRIDSHFEERPVWVVCPLSNDFISELKPPTGALLECGSRVAIGTDSLSSNTTLSMVAEMRAMPEVPLAVRLEWATIGGAEALGVESQFGRFVEGARPGAVVIEGVDFERMQLTERANSRRIV